MLFSCSVVLFSWVRAGLCFAGSGLPAAGFVGLLLLGWLCVTVCLARACMLTSFVLGFYTLLGCLLLYGMWLLLMLPSRNLWPFWPDQILLYVKTGNYIASS